MALTDAERQAAVDDLITGPKNVTVDGTSATAHDPTAIANLVDRQAAAAAARKPKRGLLFSRFRPGGAT